MKRFPRGTHNAGLTYSCMQEAVKIEILKLLDNGIIYPISDSQWVSQVHVVPKKADFTVVENEHKELVQTRLPIKFRVCIDYRKLNAR